MTKTIAISGKGGSGKTTISAMIVKYLLSCGHKNILAVDADPNACLGITLGVEHVNTIADIRDTSRKQKATTDGMDRTRSFEYGIQQAVSEAKGFDLLTMGRPEGPDCYCAANNILRKFLSKLSSAYEYVVMDNEAGMEHLSRRTTDNVDLLCIVADPNPVGMLTVRRIAELTRSLPITVKEMGVIWNRSDNGAEVEGIRNLGSIPYDKAIFDASMQGGTVFDVAPDCPAFLTIKKIFADTLNVNTVK